MRLLCAALMIWPVALQAESLVATHTLKAGAVLGPDDVTLVDADIPGAVAAADQALGQQLRSALYAGRPVLSENLTAPDAVTRNQIVSLVYQAGPLAIVIEGRALSRGAVGDVIKVMNTTSHATVTGQIGADGMIRVKPSQE